MQTQALGQAMLSGTETPLKVTPAFSRRNVAVAAGLFMVALLSLWAFEVKVHINPFAPSGAPYFVYQAQSFLHGRWNLDLPASFTDIVVVQGKQYIVYPPMPAIVLMPFVAIFGLHTSDILMTAVSSALNLSLLYLLFEQVRESGFTQRVWVENLIISVMLWFGSISLWLSLGGAVWYTAHIMCMTFTLLALLAAFRRHYTVAAVLLGSAFFCRATVIVGFLFLLYLAWQDAGTEPLLQRFIRQLWRRTPDWAAIPWRRLAGPLLVMAGVLLLFMARNTMVFGSPLDSGYGMLIAQRYPVVKTGPFNISYVPANIIANFFSFPQVTFNGPFDRHPLINIDNSGTAVSVFVTTPLFLFLFWRNRRFSATRAALWVTIGPIVVAVLLFHAYGWYQFGARYLFEAYPFAFLLLVLNDVRVDWRFAALGYLGIAINIMGAVQLWTDLLPYM